MKTVRTSYNGTYDGATYTVTARVDLGDGLIHSRGFGLTTSGARVIHPNLFLEREARSWLDGFQDGYAAAQQPAVNDDLASPDLTWGCGI